MCYSGDLGFTGSVDNFSLYRHALTPSEVAALGQPVQEQPAEVKGDVNADGSFNAADLVSMERFLLGAGDLKAPKAGELNGDGVTDPFDLVAMRKLILQ